MNASSITCPLVDSFLGMGNDSSTIGHLRVPCNQTGLAAQVPAMARCLFRFPFIGNFPPMFDYRRVINGKFQKTQTSPNTAQVHHQCVSLGVSEERGELRFTRTLHVKEQTQLENDLGHAPSTRRDPGTTGHRIVVYQIIV